MGMGPGIFGAASAQYQANMAAVDAQTASRAAAAAGRQNDALSMDVEKLFMITEALWNILKEKHGYTDENLAVMVQNIDLRDGQLDGKVANQPNPACPKCGRTLMARHPVCIYCGTVSVQGPFER